MDSTPKDSKDSSATHSGRPQGYLVALDSSTLTPKVRVLLIDPSEGKPSVVSDDGTASPTVGPDGDVFIGVLEATFGAHNARGWLLHFDAGLTQTKIPGSFGWDDTASIVPASMVPSYSGTSIYLLTTKYNNYAGTGSGDGKDKVAVLDPNSKQSDNFSAVSVTKEVLTMLGPTADPSDPGAVYEWCINTAAVDLATNSILIMVYAINNAVLFAVGR